MADEQQGTSGPGHASSADATATNLAVTPSTGDTKHTDADHGSSSLLETEELPSFETSRKIEAYEVLDHEGKSHSFKSVSQGPDTVDRVLVIFIRHFFCGSCQEYITALSEAIKPDDLLQLPVSTSIAIIGCGDPGLIDFYATETGCPFPMYADPSRKLYNDLGMASNLALGPQPDYIRKSMFRIVGESFMQALKQVPKGLVHKAGPSSQNGGELLYVSDGQPKQLTWCHRMKTTRDHIEIKDLMRLLDAAPKK
ncbi:uncharacterized protein N7469_008348 [Penicillium citrinum]|uniref:Thioredoxin-like protein AAED1 n=1 Tax=Penicillium citrinum TaxID=5077 RepID=A0A9W9NRK1_PENCI|nr:uncharacterized protein N7469_008348 [Penicillium citrinum]KAJ5224845.1 hypothetical protein N7469_008348 [Penicillium citrinum]